MRFSRPGQGAHRGLATGTAFGNYIQWKCLSAKEEEMDFIRTMQTKDWVIAAVAFVIGAIIF